MANDPFINKLMAVLADSFGDLAPEVFRKSPLLQYIDKKTKSANKGSKARGSFGNLYAIYVILEDYIKKGFCEHPDSYETYEGAIFSDIFKRQRQLPFGEKLQNHALNNRANDEFRKFFPRLGQVPIKRDLETKRYWINDTLLLLKIRDNDINLARPVISIIDEYVKAKQDSFTEFYQQCINLRVNKGDNEEKIKQFVLNLLAPNIDARIFEIASFAILKWFYVGQTTYFGFSPRKLSREPLHLYKTGRTNANDGGIDFVMRPIGRFFQVTETLDFKKYFLDIEKLERYPITFVIKTNLSDKEIVSKLKSDAKGSFEDEKMIERYISCIEEIINIPKLQECLDDVCENGFTATVLEEIIDHCKLEFNFYGDDEYTEEE